MGALLSQGELTQIAPPVVETQISTEKGVQEPLKIQIEIWGGTYSSAYIHSAHCVLRTQSIAISAVSDL